MPKLSVTYLLDKTGSMSKHKDDTIESYNVYLDELQKGGNDIDFTLIQFDSQGFEKTCVKTPIKDVPFLTAEMYIPRAKTPLIDATYETILAVEKSLADEKDTKIVITIQTDGQENASVNHTFEDLSKLIKEKTALGWEFNFLGCDINAYDQGAKMGIDALRTMSYAGNKSATRSAFAASAQNVNLYASGAAASMSFSDDQRVAAGDKFFVKDRPALGALDPSILKTASLYKNRKMKL